MVILFMLPPMRRLMESVALVRCRWLRAPSCFFFLFQWWKWAKRVLNGENSLMVSQGFENNFSRGRVLMTVDYQMRGLHHLFIVFQWWSAGPWFWKPYGLGQLVQGFFLLFLIILYFFFPFGDFAIFRNFGLFWRKKGFFWPFGGILGLLEAFQMILWPFRGILGLLEAFSGIFREIWQANGQMSHVVGQMRQLTIFGC